MIKASKKDIASFYIPCIVKADSAAAQKRRWSKISPMSKKLVAYTAILPFFDTTATSDRSLAWVTNCACFANAQHKFPSPCGEKSPNPLTRSFLPLLSRFSSRPTRCSATDLNRSGCLMPICSSQGHLVLVSTNEVNQIYYTHVTIIPSLTLEKLQRTSLISCVLNSNGRLINSCAATPKLTVTGSSIARKGPSNLSLGGIMTVSNMSGYFGITSAVAMAHRVLLSS